MAETVLKPSHREFVREYIKTSNATQSYLKAYPDVQANTAATEGGKLLKKPEIQGAIDRVEDRKDVADVASRTFLINEAHEAGVLATQDGQHRTRLAAVDVKAKLSGAYNQDAPDLDGYRDLIQSLTINNTTINVQGSGSQDSEDGRGDVIDVEKVGEDG